MKNWFQMLLVLLENNKKKTKQNKTKQKTSVFSLFLNKKNINEHVRT